jgi:hypothetical protein
MEMEALVFKKLKVGRQEENWRFYYLRDSPSPNILAAAICLPRELPGNPRGGALVSGFIGFVLAFPLPEDKADFVGTAVEKLEPVDIGVAGEEPREGEGDCIGAVELSFSPDGTAGTDEIAGSVYSWDIFCFLVFLDGTSSGVADCVACGSHSGS